MNQKELTNGSITYDQHESKMGINQVSAHGPKVGYNVNCTPQVIDGKLKFKISVSSTEHGHISEEVVITEKTPAEVKLKKGYKLKLKRTNGST